MLALQGDRSGAKVSHYRILAPIGAGGMGVVYRAHDERLERDVAIKFLPQDAFEDESARKRFRREALALSKLNHPNVEIVYDFDTEGGVDFLVMELIPGMSLEKKFAEGPLGNEELASMGAQVADGLAAAHKQGITHRDIKPSNVCITPDGLIKVLDFGLARRTLEGLTVSTTESLSVTGAVVGTVPYMSPEQLRGDAVDGRSDLYSLGALLYEGATGQRPFDGPSSPQIIGAILGKPARPPRELRPDLTSELDRIILKCLEKDPGSRHGSAKELATDLRRVPRAEGAAHAPATSGLPSLPGRSWIAAGIVLATLLTAAAVFDFGGIRSKMFRAAPAPLPSLAVLPLANLTGLAEEEYFADGMTDELITRLAQLRGLKVISRTSVMQYKGAKKPLVQIAKELDVKMLVEGAVQRASDRVMVTAKLIDASSERNLWADTFEQSSSNVLVIQSDIAKAIVERIRLQVTPGERSRLATAAPVNPQAHDLYLKGRYFMTRYDVASLRRATELFTQALELDPSHAPTYTALAESYSAQSSLSLSPRDAMPLARANAMRALEIDSTLGDAHNSLAYVTAFYDWNWKKAGVDFQDALKLNPGSANAHQYYGYYLTVNGRFEEATVEFARAHELDPLSEYISFSTLWPIYNARRYDDVVQSATALIRAYPRRYTYYLILGQAYLSKREFTKAIEALRVAADSTGTPVIRAWLGYAYAAANRRTEALAVFSELERMAAAGFVPGYGMAVIYAGLGDKDRAFEWLERGIEDRSEDMVWLKVEPGMDVLRSDPRCRVILRKLGFES